MVRPNFVPFVLLLVNLGVCAEQPTATKRNEGDILFTVVSNAGSQGKWIQETHVIAADGRNHRELLAAEQSKGDWFPRWSFGGKKIVFFGDRNGKNEGRFSMDANGSKIAEYVPKSARFGKAAKVVNERSLVPLEPDLSPDGATIVFCHGKDNEAGKWRSALYLINVDGSNLRKIDNTSQGYQARWAPEGRTIALDLVREKGPQIFLMDADGSNLRRLTHGDADNARPVWSPNGKQLAFHSNRHGGEKFEIYVMDADGSNMKQLTNHHDDKNVIGAVHPDWYVRPHVFDRPGF